MLRDRFANLFGQSDDDTEASKTYYQNVRQIDVDLKTHKATIYAYDREHIEDRIYSVRVYHYQPMTMWLDDITKSLTINFETYVEVEIRPYGDHKELLV